MSELLTGIIDLTWMFSLKECSSVFSLKSQAEE